MEGVAGLFDTRCPCVFMGALDANARRKPGWS